MLYKSSIYNLKSKILSGFAFPLRLSGYGEQGGHLLVAVLRTHIRQNALGGAGEYSSFQIYNL